MKKKLSLLVLFLCLVVVSLVSFTDGAEYGRGDVNKDGRVDMDDLTVLVNYLLTNQWPTDDAQQDTQHENYRRIEHIGNVLVKSEFFEYSKK